MAEHFIKQTIELSLADIVEALKHQFNAPIDSYINFFANEDGDLIGATIEFPKRPTTPETDHDQ